MIEMTEQITPEIVRLTLDKERWYFLDGTPHPSVTWILQYMPKGHWFYVWLADKMHSYDEVRHILQSRGEEGTMAHWGMERYVLGENVTYHDEHPEFHRGYTPKEWEMVLAGKRWCDAFEPVIRSVEQAVFGSIPGPYAGTVDLDVLIDGAKFGTKKNPYPYGEGQLECVLDWKTSQAIYDSHRTQVASYAHSIKPKVIGIIRLGSRHKTGYEFWHGGQGEMFKYFHLFKAAYAFWAHEHGDTEPKIVEYPSSININPEGEKNVEI